MYLGNLKGLNRGANAYIYRGTKVLEHALKNAYISWSFGFMCLIFFHSQEASLLQALSG